MEQFLQIRFHKNRTTAPSDPAILRFLRYLLLNGLLWLRRSRSKLSEATSESRLNTHQGCWSSWFRRSPASAGTLRTGTPRRVPDGPYVPVPQAEAVVAARARSWQARLRLISSSHRLRLAEAGVNQKAKPAVLGVTRRALFLAGRRGGECLRQSQISNLRSQIPAQPGGRRAGGETRKKLKS